MKRAFTIIEVLVVILILACLLGIFLPLHGRKPTPPPARRELNGYVTVLRDEGWKRLPAKVERGNDGQGWVAILEDGTVVRNAPVEFSR